MNKLLFWLGLSLAFFSQYTCAALDFTEYSYYQKERELYKKAMLQLQDNNFGQFEAYRSQLKKYPLATYLDYEYLRRSFPTVSSKTIDAFLTNNKGQLATKRLHIEWLGYLARTNQWSLYEQFYTAELGSEVLDCYHLQAELVIKSDDNATFKEIGEFWIKPHSIHSSCDSVFNAWSNKGLKTQDKIWRRYQLTFLANDKGMYSSLASLLDNKHQHLAQKIQNVGSNIDYWTTHLAKDHDDLLLENSTKKYLVKTIANVDYKKAAMIFEKKKIDLPKEDLMEMQRLVAWYFTKYESGEAAVNWIRQYTDYRDPTFVEPMLRYSLSDKNWALYKKVFTQLPAVLKNQEEWLYWYAITQQELQYEDKDPALTPKAIFTKLAQEQSFYGLVSAKKLNLPVFPHTQFTPQEAVVSNDIEKRLSPAIELFYLGREDLSNVDWFFTTNQFSEDEWRQAGIIAYKMAWLNRTITAFGRAKLWTAGAERFPIFFKDDFWKNAKLQQIDPGWILAVARQESAFAANARSSVGALGVLQIMPNTAKHIASKLGIGYKPKRLTEPSYNIMLGSKYLKDQLDNYDNQYFLATAAYNAGPGKVREWLNNRPDTTDWIHWVAVIPYKETRNYVQNITVFKEVYNMKLQFLSNTKLNTPDDTRFSNEVF